MVPKGAKTKPKDPEMASGAPRWRQDGAKMAPRWPQNGPRIAPSAGNVRNSFKNSEHRKIQPRLGEVLLLNASPVSTCF